MYTLLEKGYKARRMEGPDLETFFVEYGRVRGFGNVAGQGAGEGAKNGSSLRTYMIVLHDLFRQ
jgi:hypothetical protein